MLHETTTLPSSFWLDNQANFDIVVAGLVNLWVVASYTSPKIHENAVILSDGLIVARNAEHNWHSVS